MKNYLKATRVALALVIFFPLIVYFCDFTHLTPGFLHHWAEIQLVPVVLAGSIGILISLLLLTFLFGRIYCSVICPLGILQDGIARFTQRGRKKQKSKKKRWYHYHKPYNWMRYSLLAICVIFLIFGIFTQSDYSTTLLLYLDPYSNFGRISANIFRPLVIEGNNLINWVALQMNNYHFYQLTIHTVTLASFLIALIALLLVGILALLHGRLFCNSICPVGSFLGLISRISLFRVRIDESKCTKCGVCSLACKSECIDSKENKIDYSRCVSCFNCLDRCKTKALHYDFAFPVTATSASRRTFLATSTAMLASIPLISTLAQDKKTVDYTKLTPITPPGSRNVKRFVEKCTACHLCITHCPMQVLKPAGFNFGFAYAFKPHLAYSTEHFCNYECTICSKICPNDAITEILPEEKKVTQIGIAQFERSRCVVFTNEHSCGACSEHCPVQAVKMEPYKDGLTIPHVYESLCIGCGGCESICPVRPVKAINILANAVHQTAEKPQEEEEKAVTKDLDFGF